MFIYTMRTALRTIAEGRNFSSQIFKQNNFSRVIYSSVATYPSLKLRNFDREHNSHRNPPLGNTKVVSLAGIAAFLGLEKKPKDDPITASIKKGLLALQRGEFKKAEQLLHVALKISQDELNEQAVTYCYDVLANIAYQHGDYVKAEKLFVNTMQRMIANGTPQDDNAIIEMSVKIATMNGRLGNHAKAEYGFKFCRDTQRKKVSILSEKLNDDEKNNYLLLGLAMDYYGDFLMARKRYREAQASWKEALAISETLLGPENDQTLVLRSNIALTYERLGETQKSIEILEKIVAMEGLEVSEDLPIFLANLGMNYITTKNFSKAEETLLKAQKLSGKYGDHALHREISDYLEILKTKKKEGE